MTPPWKHIFSPHSVFSLPLSVCFAFCWFTLGSTGNLPCVSATWGILLVLEITASSVNWNVRWKLCLFKSVNLCPQQCQSRSSESDLFLVFFLNSPFSRHLLSSKCSLYIASLLPQRGLYFSCCKAGFPHGHFKGNKGSCKPCKPTMGTPAYHNEMTLQCFWGWGLNWSQTSFFIYKSFLCDPTSHQGSAKKKAFKMCLCLWRVNSLQKHETYRALTHSLTHRFEKILHKGWVTPVNSATSK